MKHTDKPGHEASKFRVTTGIYKGRLMSPAEIAKATDRRSPAIYRNLQRWTLCGDISPGFFALFQASQLLLVKSERITGFTSRSGLHFAVFTHQVAGLQHRYLAPLFDAKVASFVRDIAQGAAFGYSLGGEEEQAMVWPTVLGSRELQPLKFLCESVEEGQEQEVADEYADVLRDVRDPDRVPSLLHGVPVRDVSVSAIPPHDLLERLAAKKLHYQNIAL